MEKINNKSRQEMSKEFMLLQGEIKTTREFKRLLLKCIMEEVVELAQGLGVTDNDIRAMFLSAKRASHTSNESKVEVLDALVDTEYFLNQIKTVYNISEENYHEAYTRVHQANMNKCIDGKLIISDGTGNKPKGKILKPEGWKEADISDLV
jgi:predicted HAD superfamily Cof-like phosphohydrolase